MYELKRSNKFKKDFKKLSKGSYFDVDVFVFIVEMIINTGILPAKYKNHKLQGEFIGCMECHIQPDVLLIYSLDKEERIINLLRIGSHSNLF